MQLHRDFSLKAFNTFGIDVRAKRFVAVHTVEQLREVLQKHYSQELLVLGGGSNMLLTQDLNKTVVHLDLQGISTVVIDQEEVSVGAMAGENWHLFVQYTLDKGLGGLENLSLIPGNVGTAPIQNIGAYGVEVKDCFEFCKAIDVQTLEERTFGPEDCQFGYRDSFFKRAGKDRFIITEVFFRLKRRNYRLHTDYGAIREQLQLRNVDNPTPHDVAQAVIAIRKSKLPDPKVLGNSGSFFKNPVITSAHLRALQEQFPQIPHYPINEELVKVPAGWLIEQTGFKGFREGDAGVHQHQALVLVNYGKASGKDILALARKIQKRVEEDFGIEIEPEVNIY